MIILLIGPPGSGKGTLSELLVSKFNMLHLSSGMLLRRIAETKEEIANILRQGLFVSDDIINKFILEAIEKLDSKKILLLDGYPRNIEQAKFLKDKYFNVKVFYLSVKMDILEKRILGRFNCRACQKVYNKYFYNVKGICDNCGGSIFDIRNDDSLEIFKKRYYVYKEKTFPIIEFYKNNYKDQFYLIDANKSVKEIFIQIEDKIIKNKLAEC